MYSYDNQLRCIALTNSHKNGEQKITSYAYNKLGRLCNVIEPDNTRTTYTFDKNNNISTKDVTHVQSYTFLKNVHKN